MFSHLQKQNPATSINSACSRRLGTYFHDLFLQTNAWSSGEFSLALPYGYFYAIIYRTLGLLLGEMYSRLWLHEINQVQLCATRFTLAGKKVDWLQPLLTAFLYLILVFSIPHADYYTRSARCRLQTGPSHGSGLTETQLPSWYSTTTVRADDPMGVLSLQSTDYFHKRWWPFMFCSAQLLIWARGCVN